MTEERIPTTLPSPVERGEFRFIAVDAAGTGCNSGGGRWRDAGRRRGGIRGIASVNAPIRQAKTSRSP